MITREGLVGRVGPVFKHDAIVLLIIDPASHLDVMVQRTQVRSLLSGLGGVRYPALEHLQFLTRMEYMKKESEIALQDMIVTSGMDQLYPAGILVGSVEAIKLGPQGIFMRADVLPAVDFSKVKEVLILKRQK